MDQMRVLISIGELIDKITILEIKSERIADPARLVNVRKELDWLTQTWQTSDLDSDEVRGYQAELKKINETLWDIEDAIRLKEAEGVFDGEFIELARSVYLQNDRRSEVKRSINQATGSDLIEEKSYANYGKP